MIRGEMAALNCASESGEMNYEVVVEKIAKTADRKKVMDTSKSTDCPKCGKTMHGVKPMKGSVSSGVPAWDQAACSACEFFEKL